MDAFTTCLWFDTEGEEAAKLYTGLFPNSSIGSTTPYVGGERDGQVMTVEFTVNGSSFLALNGGPQFTFSESVSLMVPCSDQAEVDRYWDALVADGGEESQCGWLKDKFGLSWQILPNRLMELTGDPEVAPRVWPALLGMRKIVIADLEAAAAGRAAAVG